VKQVLLVAAGGAIGSVLGGLAAAAGGSAVAARF